MTAEVIQLRPGAPAPADQLGLNLTAKEVHDASGGYAYAARQLRELHARGFVLASIGRHGRVVLPRAHYEAVLNGQFRQQPDKAERQAPRPNREALLERIAQKRKK